MTTNVIYILAMISILSLILSGSVFLLSLSSLKKAGDNGIKRSKAMSRITTAGIIVGVSSVLSVLFIPVAVILFILNIMNASNTVKTTTIAIYILVFIIKTGKRLKKSKTKSEEVQE